MLVCASVPKNKSGQQAYEINAEGHAGLRRKEKVATESLGESGGTSHRYLSSTKIWFAQAVLLLEMVIEMATISVNEPYGVR